MAASLLKDFEGVRPLSRSPIGPISRSMGLIITSENDIKGQRHGRSGRRGGGRSMERERGRVLGKKES